MGVGMFGGRKNLGVGCRMGGRGRGWSGPGCWLQAPALGRSRSWSLERGRRSRTKPVPADLQVKFVMPLGGRICGFEVGLILVENI